MNPKITPKIYADDIFKKWRQSNDFEKDIKPALACTPTFVQKTMEHVIKNAILLGTVKDVTHLLDHVEKIPSIQLHELYEKCLARNIHRENPSLDVSALLLVKIMANVARHGQSLSIANSAKLSSALSGYRSVNHMIDVLRSINEFSPSLVRSLRPLVFESSLHEREGVCYKKWKAADKKYQLFSDPSVAPKKVAQRSSDLLSELNIIFARYTPQREKENIPPLLDVWWSFLPEADRDLLVPLETNIPWQTHSIASRIAPYIKLSHVKPVLEEMVNGGEHFFFSGRRIEMKVLRFLRVMNNLDRGWFKNTPEDERAEFCNLFKKARTRQKIKSGTIIWDEFDSMIDREMLEISLANTLAQKPRPKSLGKL